MSTSFVMLRKLTGSELGWFAAAREAGRAKGRQRGINFNAAVMSQVFTDAALRSGRIRLTSTRFSDGGNQERSIRRQKKNWRLVGDKVEGTGLEHVREGDFFWAVIETADSQPSTLVWDVVCHASDPERHTRLARDFAVHLDARMACWKSSDVLAERVAAIVGLTSTAGPSPRARRADTQSPKLPSRPLQPRPAAPRRSRRIDHKLQRPHILAEIMKSGMALSGVSQTDYVDVLDRISTELRGLLHDNHCIDKVDIGQASFWARFKGRRIGFIDGGVANVSALGAESLAIRVGSYVVVPGDHGPDRETFGPPEVQLVDELYAPSDSGGVYDDWFDDPSKLHDAARICCEMAGVAALTRRQPQPDVVLLHGPLVNPVSPYAPEGFPNFTSGALAQLVSDGRTRAGRDANFVAVYLEQLKQLATCPVSVCGVVERQSRSSLLLRSLTAELFEERAIDGPACHRFSEFYRKYRLTDAIIFECVLEPGEYVVPIEVDKQGADHKIPTAWGSEIRNVPRPQVTYVKPSVDAIPIRVESFPTGSTTYPDLMGLIVHTSRLLPRYVFPVGLDIVDKHAKVPEWMSRQMNVMLRAQLMRKAIDSNNPNVVRVVRRLLSTDMRDWLFRPDFRRG